MQRPQNTKHEKIAAIAHRLYQNRGGAKQPHNPQQAVQDWKKAERIHHNAVRKTLFLLNQPLVWVEKKGIEPISEHLKNSAVFDIVDRLSPLLEAIGVLLIPLVLYLASQSYEQQREAQELERLRQEETQELERLQQETISNYIGQLSEIFLNVEGDLRADENQRIRTITTASTITLLRDPNLDGERKRQVIEFLNQMELIRGGPQNKSATEAGFPIVSLNSANLSNADLSGADLSNASLSNASLIAANLSNASLSNASLSNADLSNASLIATNLSEASLIAANLSNADLNSANLSNADLNSADLSGADLINANLNNASLFSVNLNSADLSEVSLSAVNLSRANLSRADLSNASLSNASLSRADLSRADLSRADLSRADLSRADLSRADLSNASLSEALLLATDLRNTGNLTAEQLKGAEAPYLCNVTLPSNITGIDPNRDCDVFPQILVNQYGVTLEQAQVIVDEARKRQWE